MPLARSEVANAAASCAGEELDEDIPAPEMDHRVLAVDEVLDRLAKTDRITAELVTLRFFGGLTNEESCTHSEHFPSKCQRLLGLRQSLAATRDRKSSGLVKFATKIKDFRHFGAQISPLFRTVR